MKPITLPVSASRERRVRCEGVRHGATGSYTRVVVIHSPFCKNVTRLVNRGGGRRNAQRPLAPPRDLPAMTSTGRRKRAAAHRPRRNVLRANANADQARRNSAQRGDAGHQPDEQRRRKRLSFVE